MRVLVDTNVLIDYTKGVTGGLLKLNGEVEHGRAETVICPINVVEFLNDKYLNSNEKLSSAIEFLDRFTMIDIDRMTGEGAARLMRSGEVGLLGDALIAAVCMQYGLELLTRNFKHFEKVKGLKFYGVEKKRGGVVGGEGVPVKFIS